MAGMNGKKIMLMKDGIVVAAIISHEVRTEADRLEIAGSTQGQWREFIAGRKTWEVTANYMVVSSDMILGMLQTGQTFELKSYDKSDPTINVHGYAILEQCRIKAERGTLVHGNFKFRGTQDLTAAIPRGDFNNDYNNDFNNNLT